MPQYEESTSEEAQHNMPVKKRSCFTFIIKITFTLFCVIAFYGMYLGGQIRTKMDGQIWRLPAEVYSRIEKINVAHKLSLEEIKQLLLNNGYRQTTIIAAPGDFKIEENTIVLLRRAFHFPEQPEAQRVFRLRFLNNQLNIIEDLVNSRRVNEFSLAPKLIAMLQSEKEERLAIPLQNYPRLLIDTLILTEDRHFYEHKGISLQGITRALITNIKAGQTVQGGSTLTQQLVKNLFLTSERSLSRKINEALMAIILDWKYDKNTILETYLNEIYLGQNGDIQIHGFELASHFYFGLPIREISLDQIALLVGMIKGPSLYNPWRNPTYAIERRNVILRLMLEHKMIGPEVYELLKNRPLGVQERGQIARNYPAFLQTMQNELGQHLNGDKTSTLLGAKIFTTLDPNQQRYAEQAVVNETALLQLKAKNPFLQSAMVIADYHSGEIRAIVGGIQTQYAGFNRALTAKRQIGSLVKPSVYLTALMNPEQFRLNTPIDNQPITIHIKGSPPWQPRNYDRKHSGSVMLVDALTRSLNIPTVNIGMKVGLTQIIDTQKAMGWDNVSIPQVPSMLLGSYSISPYDVTKLYQVIANQGQKIPLTTISSIINNQGEVIYQHIPITEQVVPNEAAFQTLFAMQQVVERGTGRSLLNQFSHLQLAGKTGTTNDSRDTWFVGIDGQHVTTVWLGRDDNRETNLTGATGALEIYKNYLRQSNPSKLTLQKPDTIKWVGITEYGGWNCNNPVRTIPVWADKEQSFCNVPALFSSSEESSTLSNESDIMAEPQESLWDILEKNSYPFQAPIEEAKPIN